MKRAKQKIAALALAAVCMSFGVAGTVAYFTGSSDSHNVIETAPGVSLSVVETIDANVLPGSIVNNKVAVKAGDTSATAWVRVKVNKSIELADGVTGTADPDLVTVNFADGDANAKWHEEGGWWYYEDQLSAGDTTEILIDSVDFADSAFDLDNTYKNAQVIVSIKAQGVQVKNNGDTVLDAQGWPTESGN